MIDKFASTVRDRVNWHLTPMRRELESLRGVSSDYMGHLDPKFEEALRSIEQQFKILEVAVEELHGRE